jgi:hypothetical protein
MLQTRENLFKCHFIKNLARTDPEWNPGLRGEKVATNCLSHGTVFDHEIQLNNI